MRFFILIFMVTCSCMNTGNEGNKDSKAIDNDKSLIRVNINDINNIELILSRGAFHYDRFELKGDELRYIPSENKALSDHPEYMEESVVMLEDSVVLGIINKLIDSNVFELDSVYPAVETDSAGGMMEFTCNSSLELKLTIRDKTVQIKCHDYQKGCPDVLTDLEKELIRLHGKNLVRRVLPG
jgi:hypothetical protein